MINIYEIADDRSERTENALFYMNIADHHDMFHE
jgi:hypothetical protein